MPDAVVGSALLADDLCHQFQDFVADARAVLGVQQLEIVHIEHDQTQRGLAAAGAFQFTVGRGEEGLLVHQARQEVEDGHVFELILGLQKVIAQTENTFSDGHP
jgi:hypothetical protein